MSYTANIYNIMIASPSDLNVERSIAEEVINEWNKINSESRKVFLVATGWETLPPIIDNQSIQSQIDKKILSKADILVTIFWHKFGTPTFEFPSATVHELETHLQASKPALLYFSDKPVKISIVKFSQVENVKALKEEYYSKGKIATFESEEQFRKDFRIHLATLVNDADYKITGYNTIVQQSLERNVLVEKDLSDQAKLILFLGSKDEHGNIIKDTYSKNIRVAHKALSYDTDLKSELALQKDFTELVDKNYIEQL